MMMFEMPDTQDAGEKLDEIKYHGFRPFRILQRNPLHTDHLARRRQAALMLVVATCPLQQFSSVRYVEVK
jgi:hypothetical protein